MSLLDDFKRFVADAEAGSQFAAWKRDNKADYARWATFRDAILSGVVGPRPTMSTAHGRELVDVGLMYLDATPVVTPPPPAGWAVAPPTGNVTHKTNVNGIPILAVNQPGQTLSDYIVDGCSNSVVLAGPECKGLSIVRLHATRAYSIDPYLGYGRHGFYVKWPDGKHSDIYMGIDPAVRAKDPSFSSIGSVFSFRYPGHTVERVEVTLCKWYASFFGNDDPSTQDGEVRLTGANVVWDNPQDHCAMIWDAPFRYSTIFEDHHWVGPSDNLGTIDSGCVPPVIEFHGCSSNGKSITPAMIGGATKPAKLTIS